MKRKMMKLLALALAVVTSVSMFSGCWSIYNSIMYENSKVELEVVKEPQLSSTYNEESGYYDAYVEGIFKNPTEETVSMSVDVVLYDAEGNVIGSAYDYITEVAGGETWRFCAIAQTSFEPASFRINQMEGMKAYCTIY